MAGLFVFILLGLFIAPSLQVSCNGYDFGTKNNCFGQCYDACVTGHANGCSMDMCYKSLGGTCHNGRGYNSGSICFCEGVATKCKNPDWD